MNFKNGVFKHPRVLTAFQNCESTNAGLKFEGAMGGGESQNTKLIVTPKPEDLEDHMTTSNLQNTNTHHTKV